MLDARHCNLKTYAINYVFSVYYVNVYIVAVITQLEQLKLIIDILHKVGNLLKSYLLVYFTVISSKRCLTVIHQA